jgi:hypothetical protein
MVDMEKNQSAFYNYNTVSELMSQNYASIYTSDNTQFNDLNLDALVVNSDNFPMIRIMAISQHLQALGGCI